MTRAEFLQACEKSLTKAHFPNFDDYIAIFEHYFDYDMRRHSWNTLALQQKGEEYFAHKDVLTLDHLRAYLLNELTYIIIEYV